MECVLELTVLKKYVIVSPVLSPSSYIKMTLIFLQQTACTFHSCANTTKKNKNQQKVKI